MGNIVDIDDDVQLYVIGILVELDAVLGDDVAERWNKSNSSIGPSM